MLTIRKLKDESGATILISMLVSVVVLMVCTIMVSAALSNATQADRARVSEQYILNTGSAAAYLKEDLLNSTFTVRESFKTNVNTEEITKDYATTMTGNYVYNEWLSSAYANLYDETINEVNGSFVVDSEFADIDDINVEINFIKSDEKMADNSVISYFDIYATFKILNASNDDISYITLHATGVSDDIESDGGIEADGLNRYLVRNVDHVLTFQDGNIRIDRNKPTLEAE